MVCPIPCYILILITNFLYLRYNLFHNLHYPKKVSDAGAVGIVPEFGIYAAAVPEP